MPDVHEGYGSPIGGVFATRAKDGIISPGAVGYDENCGVRLLKSSASADEIENKLDGLAAEIQKTVPSGLGKGHLQKLIIPDLDKILENGAQEIIRQGYGEKEDAENCESRGRLEWANASEVSQTAKNRGRDQVGTLGSGNHFLEIQKVDEIFDENTAQIFGLFKNQAAIMIHTGSRGLGHQIATDYIRLMLQAMPKYGIQLPDKELACAPFNSSEGQRFFKAMACGANFAWANRQMITYYIRECWKKIFGNNSHLSVLYDVAHNIAKLEKNPFVDSDEFAVSDRVLVHRKGATRAFPPNHPEIPEKYRAIGQPVIIPGSMGTASYVLRGAEEGKESFYSSCHGAGRVMSRHQAIKTLSGKEIIKNLENRGIIVKCYSMKGIAEEAPQAYKNIDEVVDIVHQAGLSKKVARLIPLAVIKGE
jgi:tRNA-splicing ligase RtcB